MNTKIILNISEPCPENWQLMTPTEKGRFCDSCQKNVFDFTKATDRQILKALDNKENVCGRFKASQLNRTIEIPKEKSPLWLATTSAIISFLSLWTNNAYAQGESKLTKIERTNKKILNSTAAVNDTITEKEITGTVSDELGAIPGANIRIKGTQNNAIADFNGNFKINAKEGDILVCTFLGMLEQNITIDKSKHYNITMLENNMVLGGATMGVMVCTKKRTFLGRTFHKIGNLFR
jgi:hypothetical protein